MLAHFEAETLGSGALPLAVIPHPLGALSVDEVHSRADSTIADVVHALVTPAVELMTAHYADCDFAGSSPVHGPAATEHLDISSSLDAVNDHFHEQGWTDGLPVVPPTQQRVQAMLRWAGRNQLDIVATLPPNWAPVTVEQVAVNAVMAGCRPEYLPLLLAAIEAISQPEFNLYAIQATTHPAAPVLIFNGPIPRAVGVHSGAGLLGPGWRANATIGRALRLALLNLGGARAGHLDKATMGHPGKYSYCLAENEAQSPWEPLHVEAGFSPDVSTVSVLAAEGPHNINDHYSVRAEGLLHVMAGAMAQTGANNNWYDSDLLLLVCPEHASVLARDGLSKTDVKRYLVEHARSPMSKWSAENIEGRFRKKYPDRYGSADPQTTLVPVVQSPESLRLVVAGGAGKHSMHMPTMGTQRMMIRPLVTRSGEPARSLDDFS